MKVYGIFFICLGVVWGFAYASEELDRRVDMRNAVMFPIGHPLHGREEEVVEAHIRCIRQEFEDAQLAEAEGVADASTDDTCVRVVGP